MTTAKPSAAYGWDTTSANLIAPTSGHQSNGYSTNEVPTSTEWNGLLQNLTAWTAWLNILATTGGGAAGNIDINGNANFGGTLAAGGLITATGGVTAAANQHATVSGTGQFKHGTRTLTVAATAGVPSGTSPNPGNGSYGISGTGSAFFVPILLETGKRVTGARVIIIDSTTGPTLINFIVTSNVGGVATNIGGSSNSAGTGVAQTLTAGSFTNTTIVAGMTISVEPRAASGSATWSLCGIEIDYDNP